MVQSELYMMVLNGMFMIADSGIIRKFQAKNTIGSIGVLRLGKIDVTTITVL
jgi:hypothetical protein